MCCNILGISASVLTDPGRTDSNPLPIFPAKPVGEWCRFCSRPGCSVYDHRPSVCRDFSCVWLNTDLGPEFRPDRIRAVLVETDIPELKQIVLHVAPEDFLIHDTEPMSTLISTLTNVYEFDIIVMAGEKRRILTADMERWRGRVRAYGERRWRMSLGQK